VCARCMQRQIKQDREQAQSDSAVNGRIPEPAKPSTKHAGEVLLQFKWANISGYQTEPRGVGRGGVTSADFPQERHT
jgi:hypothetical protein